VLTTRPLPKPRSAITRFAMRTIFYVGIFVSGTALFVVAFFVYDASTYRESPTTETLPVSSLALTPRRFGPKNLPVVEHFVDDDHTVSTKHRPRVVILGTGWGAVSLIKSLKAEDYHVTVISPSNQFLFTPMLPSASTGTLELRSLVEPVRKIICRIHGHFLKAMAVDVCFSEKLVEVEATDSRGQPARFYVPYDKLVIACGMSLKKKSSPLICRIRDQPARRAWPCKLPLPQGHPRRARDPQHDHPQPGGGLPADDH
jgi:NADH dehydrogenase